MDRQNCAMRFSQASSIGYQDRRMHSQQQQALPSSLDRCAENHKENGQCEQFVGTQTYKATLFSKPPPPTTKHLSSLRTDYVFRVWRKMFGRGMISIFHYDPGGKENWHSRALQMMGRSSTFKYTIVSLLLILAVVSVSFPIASFEATERDFLIAAQQSWNASSRRAKQVVMMWETSQEKESTPKTLNELEKKLYGEIVKFPTYWERLTALFESLSITYPSGRIRLGLVNFKEELESEMWAALTGGLDPVVFELEPPNSNLTWKHLFPEWIDEEEMYEVPRCPSLSMPAIAIGTQLDIVLAKLPCNRSENWPRNVVRLQMQLAAAKIATDTNSSHVILLSECPPLPNLFACRELVARNGDLQMYMVNQSKLRKKLALPIGSCELAVPLKGNLVRRERIRTRPKPGQEAYVTLLHSTEMYVCGAIALAQSIRATGSSRDIVILIDEAISPQNRKGLEEAGWRIVKIDRIRNPQAEPAAYNEWNYSKLRLWQLTAYEKLIFIDSDSLVLRNIDFLFEEAQEISASSNSRTVFNSGLMVVEPASCTFELLVSLMSKIFSYNGGDQGYLNEVYTWWHRLPKRMNYLKHFYTGLQDEYEEKTRLFGMRPPGLYVLHFLGIKPWLCFRDYDCNWHFREQHTFASDVAHGTWFKVYDAMPPSLQSFCHLSLNQTAALVADMDAAAHIFPRQKNISDPRFLYPTL